MSRTDYANPTLAPSHGPADAMRLLAKALEAGASAEALSLCAVQVDCRARASEAAVQPSYRPHLAVRAADAWRRANDAWATAAEAAKDAATIAKDAEPAAQQAAEAEPAAQQPAGRAKGPRPDSMLGRAIARLREAGAPFSVPWLWSAIKDHFPSPGATPQATLSAALLRASRQGLVRRAGRGLWEAL